MPNQSPQAASNIIAALPLYPAIFPAYQKRGGQDPYVSNRLACNNLYSKYRAQVDEAVRICNVPREMILATMFIENGAGNPSAVSSSGAVGLMQLKPATASDILITEGRKGRLTQEELSAIGAIVGAAGVARLKTAKQGTAIITAQHLKNARLNIILGSMLLGQLIDEHTEGGILRLDKVFARYNQGYYYKPGNGDASIVLATAKKRSAEVYNYLLKALGTNGVMQCLMA